jgi:hypothetical protein
MATRDVLMEYIYINIDGHLLFTVDNFSRKPMLPVVQNETAEQAALALMAWEGAFGLAENFTLVTDNGSHFANSLFKELMSHLRGRHRFSVAYAPWTNGAVENMNSSILKIIRQITSELQYDRSQWQDHIGINESQLNNRPIRSRNGFTAQELFMGFKKDLKILPKLLPEALTLKEIRDVKRFEDHCEKLRKDLETKHQKVYEQVEFIKAMVNAAKNKKLRFCKPILQFQAGDWVLFSVKDLPFYEDKTRNVWQGPLRVVGVEGTNVYKIKSLLGRTYRIHASRLMFYAGNDYEPGSWVRALALAEWK